MSSTCVALLAVGVFAGLTPATASPSIADPFINTGTGSSPRSIAVGASGEFFVAQYGTDTVATYAADGSAEPLRSMVMPSGSHPIDVAVDAMGGVWSANADGHALARFVPGDLGPALFTVGATVVPESVTISRSGIVYSANGSSDTVSKVEKVGTTYIGTPVFASLGPGSGPVAVATDAAGNVYTANANNSTVSQISPTGRVTDVFAKLPTGSNPGAIAVDSKGMLFLTDTARGRVFKIDPSLPVATNLIATYNLEGGAKPSDLIVDSRDNVYATSRLASNVSVIPVGAVEGTIIQTMPAGSGVSGMAISAKDVLFSTSFARNAVSSIDLTTVITLTKPVADVPVGTPVSGSLVAQGVDPLVFTSGDAPSWITIDPKTGAFSGSPTSPGPVSFTINARSLVGTQGSVTVALTVTGAAPTPTPTPTPTPSSTGSPTPGQTTPPTPGTGGGASTGSGSGAGSGAGSGTAVGRGGAGTGSTGSLAHTGTDGGAVIGLGASALGLVALGSFGVIRRSRRRSA